MHLLEELLGKGCFRNHVSLSRANVKAVYLERYFFVHFFLILLSKEMAFEL